MYLECLLLNITFRSLQKDFCLRRELEEFDGRLDTRRSQESIVAGPGQSSHISELEAQLRNSVMGNWPIFILLLLFHPIT